MIPNITQASAGSIFEKPWQIMCHHVVYVGASSPSEVKLRRRGMGSLRAVGFYKVALSIYRIECVHLNTCCRFSALLTRAYRESPQTTTNYNINIVLAWPPFQTMGSHKSGSVPLLNQLIVKIGSTIKTEAIQKLHEVASNVCCDGLLGLSFSN